MRLPDDPAPVRPPEPDAADCCGEGCARCVFDVHEEALERHEAELAAWQARHPGVDPSFTRDSGLTWHARTAARTSAQDHDSKRLR